MELRTKTRMLAFSAVATAVIVPLSALPAHAYAYTNRVQTTDNYAGVIFYPYGDNFEIWNNVPGGRAYVTWNYKDINDSPKKVGSVYNYQSPYLVNLDMVEGREIYFKVTWTDENIELYSSPIVYFRTGGANP